MSRLRGTFASRTTSGQVMRTFGRRTCHASSDPDPICTGGGEPVRPASRARSAVHPSSESGSSRRRASLFNTSALIPVAAAASSAPLLHASGNTSLHTVMMLSARQVWWLLVHPKHALVASYRLCPSVHGRLERISVGAGIWVALARNSANSPHPTSLGFGEEGEGKGRGGRVRTRCYNGVFLHTTARVHPIRVAEHLGVRLPVSPPPGLRCRPRHGAECGKFTEKTLFLHCSGEAYRTCDCPILEVVHLEADPASPPVAKQHRMALSAWHSRPATAVVKLCRAQEKAFRRKRWRTPLWEKS